MKKMILNLGFVLLFLNTIVGLMLSNYSTFNWIAADAVILINVLLTYEISRSNRRDGFKISLSILYSFFTLVMMILALLSPSRLQDNYYLIGIVVILFIELALSVTTNNMKAVNTNYKQNKNG